MDRRSTLKGFLTVREEKVEHVWSAVDCGEAIKTVTLCSTIYTALIYIDGYINKKILLKIAKKKNVFPIVSKRFVQSP